MEWEWVGEVVHFFDRISVAVLRLDEALSVGDWIGFVQDGDLLFEQEVASMQINRQDIASAQAGEDIGLKVQQPVTPGIEVYKVV